MQGGRHTCTRRDGELHLLVGPKLLGDGLPVFTGPPTPLRLLEVRQLDDSELVLHRYDARPVADA